MLFLVIAHDGRDPDAHDRRRKVRAQHLDEVRPLVDEGTVRLGGAYLDDEGEMAGSVLLLESESAETARATLEADIYFRSGVWQRFDIYPYRHAVGQLS